MDAELRDEVKRIIIAAISEELSLPPEEINEEMHLRNDLDMDSLDVVSVGSSLEAEYNIEIDNDVIDGIETISDIVSAVVSAIKKVDSD